MNEFPIITILDNAFNTLDYIDGYESIGWYFCNGVSHNS